MPTVPRRSDQTNCALDHYIHDDEGNTSNQYVKNQQEQYYCCITKYWAVLEQDHSLIDTVVAR